MAPDLIGYNIAPACVSAKLAQCASGPKIPDNGHIKVRGQWMYLYRAIDSLGYTVEFFFSENRDLVAAKRFLHKALARHGQPERIVIDGSRTNTRRSFPATLKADCGSDRGDH